MDLLINDVKPNLVTIGHQLEDGTQLESIYVYIFDSEQARKDGLVTFNQLLKKADFAAYPFAYEQKNTLVIYYNLKKENPNFGEKIQTALQKL